METRYGFERIAVGASKDFRVSCSLDRTRLRSSLSNYAKQHKRKFITSMPYDEVVRVWREM